MCARHVLVESKVSVTSPRSSLLQPAARLLRKPLEGRTHRHVRGSVSTPCRSTRSCERPVAEAAGLGRLQALDDLPVSFYTEVCLPHKKTYCTKSWGESYGASVLSGGEAGNVVTEGTKRARLALVSVQSHRNAVAHLPFRARSHWGTCNAQRVLDPAARTGTLHIQERRPRSPLVARSRSLFLPPCQTRALRPSRTLHRPSSVSIPSDHIRGHSAGAECGSVPTR